MSYLQAIDKYISKAQKNSYATLMDVGRKGLNVATDTLVKTAVTVRCFFFVKPKFNIFSDKTRVVDIFLRL